ncbi:chymotrypsin family serine protease [Actinophytocola xanthii]|uniref:Serine protease n=1 Tax=Actinophytocola xanthii TaxID=1912961 RepID=A0A1Q8CDU3_9PSEU|nr:hypothetical protein [Actinophytocola xanthii]OLF12548.1 hypothetical protein BU204_29015 [Actinophytocola xanthii]
MGVRLRRNLLTSLAVAAVAMAVGTTLAQAEGKPDGNGRSATQRAVPADQASGRSALAVSAEVSRASASIQKRIADHVRDNGTRYTFGAYADAVSGKVVVETDAPAEVVSSLVGPHRGMVEVRRQAVTDNFSRRDDVPAYWGGAGITDTPGLPHCSAGYTVQNSSGARFMVTAGHCFGNGTNAFTELGGRYFGTAFGNGLPSQDMVLLGGESYGSFIYVGGVNSSTGHHVASAGNPVVGFTNYCHSGRTTGEHCGHTVNSVNGIVCTSSGCKSPVMVWTGGVLTQGGDSGSPVYALSVSGTDKHIRGHNIAASGNTRYAELWSRVQARFGVSIVT